MVPIAENVLDGVVVAGYAWFAWAFGWGIQRLLGVRCRTAEGCLGLRLCWGFGTFGMGAYLSGLLGLWPKALFWGPVGLGLAGALVGWANRGRPGDRPKYLLPRLARSSVLMRLGLAGVFVIAVLALVRAMAPPTAGDALCYHLELPKQFLILGRVTDLWWTDQALFPLLSEFVHLIPLAWRGEVAAQLVHWVYGIALLLAVMELCSILGSLRAAGLALWVAAAAPIWSNHASVPFSDLPTAVYGTWATTFAVRALRLPTFSAAVALGLSVGFAAGCKLTGLGWTVCLLSVWYAALLGSRLRRTAASRQGPSRCPVQLFHRKAQLFQALGQSLLASAVGLALAAAWYGRSWLATGNPFHPYFREKFVAASAAELESHRPHLGPNAWARVVAIPWEATFHPEKFGGRGHQWGSAFLALIPGIALFRPRRGTWLVIALVLCFGFWAALKPNLRHLLPLFGSMSALAGVAASQAGANRGARWAVALVLAVHGLAGGVAALRRALPCLPVALGLESRSTYLSRCEPTMVVARQLGRSEFDGALVLTQEHRLYYFPVPTVREDALQRRRQYEASGKALLHLYRQLGFTHLLLARSANPAVADYDQSVRRRLGQELNQLRKVWEGWFEGPGSDHRCYELYELGQPLPGESRWLLEAESAKVLREWQQQWRRSPWSRLGGQGGASRLSVALREAPHGGRAAPSHSD